ncbi:peptidase C12, ubiquitin carboxyl-terminal hydrolase 1 [Laetiporus sulphureus 93-53]|uniref:Ubiquitin carboxyl-terminal hydrolase n=1 Tax=Laetiporus sulphureus 93-53 TaxID=1314785 RepID=A0A165G9K6_9APHY|nr:peptidase C12, ubiquitin carboxyl-terminal hydrolase 1 [Laetiporus sulphureus 93-53]KZT10029.1 peptidase C12, ubiquitin carboxyl-terminal hydrolase 1 [Laetiporus sulphureus 93-53]
MSETSSRWIPLESNPDVLNQWAEKAGLVLQQDRFVDVYGLDPELLAMVPQPVDAVILLFPITDAIEARAKQEDERIKLEGQHPIDPTVFYIKQTISNACGTIGLLHALANSHATFVPDSPLALFIDQCRDKTPEERAKLLETTPLFANIHAEAASSGQTAVPSAEAKVDLHFTCFVQAPNPPRSVTEWPHPLHLIELDGRRAGPIDRGLSKNLLEDVATFVKNNYMSQTASMEFSMIALASSEG